MKKEKNDILEAFLGAIPKGLSNSALANGIDVEFEYKGKAYKVNTKVEGYTRYSIADYYVIIGRRAINAVQL